MVIIRKASKQDLGIIENLHNRNTLNIKRLNEPNYSSQVEKEGFTVSSGNSNLPERIQNSEVFNVAEENRKIIGYIDINREIYFPKEADNIVWFDSDLKHEYFDGEKVTILHHIAVFEEYKGRGVAKLLLNDAIEKLKKRGIKHLFAIVTIAPLTNCASIIFHTKMGFSRACVTMPIDLFGLKNYQSLLFYKYIF